MLDTFLKIDSFILTKMRFHSREITFFRKKIVYITSITFNPALNCKEQYQLSDVIN